MVLFYVGLYGLLGFMFDHSSHQGDRCKQKHNKADADSEQKDGWASPICLWSHVILPCSLDTLLPCLGMGLSRSRTSDLGLLMRIRVLSDLTQTGHRTKIILSLLGESVVKSLRDGSTNLWGCCYEQDAGCTHLQLETFQWLTRRRRLRFQAQSNAISIACNE